MKNGVPSVFSRMSCFRAWRGAPWPVSPDGVSRPTTRREILPLPLCRTAPSAVACNTSSAPTHGGIRDDSSPAAGPWPGYTLTQHIEKALRFAVNPVQVLKDENQRLVETLAEEQLLERLKRPSPPNLRVHLL